MRKRILGLLLAIAALVCSPLQAQAGHNGITPLTSQAQDTAGSGLPSSWEGCSVFPLPVRERAGVRVESNSKRRMGLPASPSAVIWHACPGENRPLTLTLSPGAREAWHHGEMLCAPQGRGNNTPPLAGSGVIQAREVVIASEFAGRVRTVHVAEGDSVAAGAPLLALEDDLSQANLAQAEAGVQAAAAELAALKAGTRAEEIAAAEAAVSQAKAALAGAEAALRNATSVRSSPQELDARRVEARTCLAGAQQALEAARAESERAAFERDRKPFNSSEWHAAEFRRQAAVAGVAAAEADLAAAQANVDGLEAIRAQPLALLAAEHKAAGGVETARAALAVAEARLADLRAGPQAEEVALAEAKLALARAQAAALRHQRERLTLYAPADGVVLTRLAEPGETVLPGAPLLRIGDLRHVELVLYVPEPRIGEVALGQTVAVTVDSYPGRPFTGHVTHIADRAEFTPRNIATREERVNTYYAVRVSLPNPDGALKPGMPADAVVEGQ